MNGEYKVAYKLRTDVPVTQEQFKLRIKTARENAVVLLGKGRASQDELRLEIKDSRFVMTSTGKGKVKGKVKVISLLPSTASSKRVG